MPQPFRIEVAGETNIGRKRNHNEDNFAILAEFGLFIVADGMGGHASGEVASKLAVDAMREFFGQTAEDPERTSREVSTLPPLPNGNPRNWPTCGKAKRSYATPPTP